jgi:hypothetical protein
VTDARDDLVERLPGWLDGLTHKDWLFDGGRCTPEQWEFLDWSHAYVDLGPSIAGNLGPYWHVPDRDGDCTHRLYPKMLQGKWLHVIRQAIAQTSATRIQQLTARAEAAEASLRKIEWRLGLCWGADGVFIVDRDNLTQVRAWLDSRRKELSA